VFKHAYVHLKFTGISREKVCSFHYLTSLHYVALLFCAFGVSFIWSISIWAKMLKIWLWGEDIGTHDKDGVCGRENVRGKQGRGKRHSWQPEHHAERTKTHTGNTVDVLCLHKHIIIDFKFDIVFVVVVVVAADSVVVVVVAAVWKLKRINLNINIKTNTFWFS